MGDVLQGQKIALCTVHITSEMKFVSKLTTDSMALICTLSADEKTGPESLQRLRICCRAKN